MRTKVDCLPCILRQAIRAARAALKISEGDLESHEHTIRAIVNRVSMLIPGMDLSKTPPEVAAEVYDLVSYMTGVKDPYAEVKEEHIRKALELYDKINDIVSNSDDKLRMAIKVAIIGNAIDLGAISDNVEVSEILSELYKGNWSFSEEAFETFKANLEEGNTVLYIADNAGETVFDRPLLELIRDMGKKVRYAVRSFSIVNDATKEDALRSGIPEELIIETGSKFAGVVLRDCSEKFRRLFRNADLIIAKGQGNFETLSNEEGPIFFLLKAKCSPVATALGVPLGTLVFKTSPKFSRRKISLKG